jgi:hypothetical protein
MEYEDGLVLSFIVTIGCDFGNRTIRIIGTDGRVDGDIVSGEIGVGHMLPLSRETLTVTDDGTGHHGGDGAICREFADSILHGAAHRPTATIEDGFHSAMVAFATERARLEHRQVEVAEIYRDLGLRPGTVEELVMSDK